MKVVLKKKEDKKKVWLLAVLGLVAAVTLYVEVFSGDSTPGPSVGNSGGQMAPAVLPADTGSTASTQRRGLAARRNSSEWRVSLKSKNPEDRPDPAKIDPTLRMDLLAKVQSVSLEGGSRNLFQFGAVAPPPAAGPLPKERKIAINNPAPVVAPPSGPPPPPPPPAIPLKYYGYSNARGETRKKAFFLNGEEIVVAWEGETIDHRYKVVHVGVNSVDVEDVQFKNKQTLPLAEEAAA
ncbi:MAG: hypothetical protein JWO80_4463 [Bryobacterales bacterium]|nr:hypothetical protein [Bryobacterales bacterium]